MVNLSLSLSTVAPTLEHRTSVKRFVSPLFLNLRELVGLLERGISPLHGRYLHNTTQTRTDADRHPCLEWNSNS
jgi:hypothetical protein